MARSLLAEIASGKYPIGHRLPNEIELGEQFGASRFTVRAAMDRLVQAGIVSRRPRIGTIVEAIRSKPFHELMVRDVEDIQQFGSATKLRVLKKLLRVVPHDSPPPLDGHVGETWLYVEGLRTVSTAPELICFNEVWVGPDYRGVDGIKGTVTRSIWAHVEEQFGVRMASVQQDIRATSVGTRAAKAMGLPRGSPVLYVRRAYYDENHRLFELSVSIHPPDSFVYRLTIERRARADGSRAGKRV